MIPKKPECCLKRELIGFQITISEDLHGEEVVSMVGKVGEKLVISIPKPKLWSPDTPHLYQVSIFFNLPNDALTSNNALMYGVWCKWKTCHRRNLSAWATI